MLKVKVFELVGKNAISMQSGSKLNKVISEPLLNNEKVEIDFQGGCTICIPLF